jgi:hypothetical protein
LTAADIVSLQLSEPEHRAQLRKAVIASTVGTTIEWYDFLLYSIVTPLGHRLIMAQPELGGSEFEHGEEVCGVLLVAGGEASEVFDAIEEPFDTIARPVEHRAEAGFPATITIAVCPLVLRRT